MAREDRYPMEENKKTKVLEASIRGALKLCDAGRMA
jgi:hypothetical protein